jgi:MFS family permease
VRPPFYGWVVVAVAFVTMAIGVNARTAFSLLFPSILDEFGWERGVTAASFSVGFLVSASFAPFLGTWMDRQGPRVVLPVGVVAISAGLALATVASRPWHLALTLGVLVSCGSVLAGYTGHGFFLPNWFVRRRGIAMGIAFSGVGIGSMILFPWLQALILAQGWRTACWAMSILVLVTLGPLNAIFQRLRPEDLGLAPDGDAVRPSAGTIRRHPDNVVDAAWVAVDWTLGRAARTARFWWVFAGFFASLFAWYAVQVHQTKYLTEIGFSPAVAAWALGLVGLCGVAGQIGLGHLSDRIGREWVWTIASAGYVACYAILLVMHAHPTPPLLFAMVATQGVLGYGLSAVYGAIPAELFQGRHYGSVFGVLSIASSTGAGAGPWVSGLLHDWTGSYAPAFWLAIVLSVASTVFIWLAAPRNVRAVAGRVPARAG